MEEGGLWDSGGGSRAYGDGSSLRVHNLAAGLWCDRRQTGLLFRWTMSQFTTTITVTVAPPPRPLQIQSRAKSRLFIYLFIYVFMSFQSDSSLTQNFPPSPKIAQTPPNVPTSFESLCFCVKSLWNIYVYLNGFFFLCRVEIIQQTQRMLPTKLCHSCIFPQLFFFLSLLSYCHAMPCSFYNFTHFYPEFYLQKRILCLCIQKLVCAFFNYISSICIFTKFKIH